MNDVERWLARQDPGQRLPRLPRPPRGCSAVVLAAAALALAAAYLSPQVRPWVFWFQRDRAWAAVKGRTLEGRSRAGVLLRFGAPDFRGEHLLLYRLKDDIFDIEDLGFFVEFDAAGAVSHAHIEEMPPLDTERGARYLAEELPSLDHPRTRRP